MALQDDYLNTIEQLESGGVQGRTSSRGAIGKMQTMSATRGNPGYGVTPARDDSLDEADRVGRDYALAMLEHYKDPALALAAYNAGPGAVNKHGGIPPYAETQNYVRKGMAMLGGEGTTIAPAQTEEEEYQAYAKQRDEEEKEYQAYAAEQDKLAAEKKALEPPQELPDRTMGQIASDVGTSLEKGIIGAEQSLVGLADIPMGGRVGKYLEEQGFGFEKNQKLLEEQYSPQQKAENKALSNAHGVMGVIEAVWENPNAVGAMLGESVPAMLAGGLLGKVAKIAKGVSVAGAAGIGEGLIAAGGAEENIRSQSEDGLVSGKGTLAAIGTGIGTGLLGAVGSKLTTKLGGIDADTLLIGGARREIEKVVGVEAATSPNVFKRVVTSALGEGVFEEAPQSAQEQMWQNYATDKPLMQGVPESATKGALLGSIMGGAVGSLPSAQAPKPLTDEGERKEEPSLQTEQEQAVVKKNALKSVGLGPTHKMHEEMMQQDFSTPEGIAAAEAFVQGNSEKLGGINDDAWGKLIAKSKERVGVEPSAVITPATEQVKAPVVEQATEQVKAPVVEQARAKEIKAAEVSNQLFNAAVNLQEGYIQAQEEDAMYGQSKTMPKVKAQFNKIFSGLLSTKEKKALYEHWFEEGNLGSGDFTGNEYFDLAHTNLMNGVNPPVKTPIVEPVTTPAAKVPKAKEVKAEVAPVVEEVKASEPIQIDEAKVTAYDNALERANVLAEGGSKGAARPFMKSLVAQGLISAAQLKKYGNDAPLTELMQAVNTDLQTGRETTLTTSVAATKITPHTKFGAKKTEVAPIEEGELTEFEKRQQTAGGFQKNIAAKKVDAETAERARLDELARLRQVKRDSLVLGKSTKKGSTPSATAIKEDTDKKNIEQEFYALSNKESMDIHKNLSGAFDFYGYLNITNPEGTGINDVHASNAKTALEAYVAQQRARNTLAHRLSGGKDFFALDKPTQDKIRYIESLTTQADRQRSQDETTFGRHEWYKRLSSEVFNAAKRTPTETELNAKVTAARPRKKAISKADESELMSDQGEHDYSVAPTPATTGHTAASLAKSLSPEMKALAASGKAVIHDTAEGLNKVIPGTHPANVQGLTTKEGVTHYVANKLTPHTLQGVALHEAGVHAGLRKLVGEKVWADITDQAANDPHPTHEAARKAVPKNTPDHLKAEEALAYLVQNSPHMPVVRRLISAIRNWARTTFGANIKLTESDARHLAMKSLRKESKTTERTAREETAFSKEKLLAPNGKPSNLNPMQHAQVRTPAFKKWFGDWENDPENASKAVDENGEPVVVYHGTEASFNAFKRSKLNPSIKGIGFDVTSDINQASGFSVSDGANILPLFANIRTPKKVFHAVPFNKANEKEFGAQGTSKLLDSLKANGYDGIAYSKGHYTALDPNQLKSAIGNTGAFSTENDDIRYSLSPSEQASATAREARVGTPAVKPAKTPFYKNIDSTISNAETKYLSYDAKFINTLRNSIKKLGLPVQAMQKLMLRASQSQTVQATATAGAAATQGDIKYNPNSYNWEAVAGKHSAPRLRQFIEDMAVAKGESYDTVNKIFGDIMVAARIDEIYKKADKIKAKIKADKTVIRGMQAHIDTLTNKQDIIDASEILKTAENTLRRYRLNNIKKLRIAVNEQRHMSKKEVAGHMQTLAANPEYKKPLEEWQGIRKSVIEFLVASGRYSQEQADAYMDAVSYVPFQRIMHDMDVDSDTAYVRASEKTVGKAGLSAGQRERAMRGSAREVDDIVSNIEKWVVNSYIKGIKAAKSKELIDLADSYLPPGAVTALEGPELGAVTCYREGIKEYWRFDDPFMTFAFNGINNPLTVPTLKTGARVANKLREFIVLNPLFTISQLPQDTFAAMISSGVKHPFALPLEVIKEFGATLFNTQRAKTGAHAKLAAIGATGQKDFVDSFASSIHDIAYGGDVKKKSALVKHLEHIAMAGDNAVRQAVYNRTLKEMKGHPLAEAIAQERAFEIINFRRKGASASLDAIRQITPFFGAYLQAQRVALNVLSGRGIAPTERKEAMQTLAITTAKVAAFTVLYNMALGAAGIGGDDEDESDFTKRSIKDRDKKIFIPGTKATLPLRQDVFSIPFIVANHAYQYMFEKGTKNPAEAWKAVGMAVLHTFPGVGMPMGPTIAKPILEVAINHDFFTGRDITPMRLQGKDTSLQYNEQTSEIAKMLGKTGYINPMYVDHIVKGLTGYVGGAALAVSDMAIRAGLDTPYMEKGILGKGARDIPGMTSLLAKDYDPKDVDTYYTMRTEIDKVHDTYNALKKLGKREEAKEYKTENRLALKEGVHQQLNKMVSKVDAINEKIRKLAETPNEVMSPEVKRARRDQLDAKIRHIESGINRLYPRVHPE